MESNSVVWHAWGVRKEGPREYWTWLAVDARTAAWASARLIPTLLLEPWRARLAERIPTIKTVQGERRNYDATALDASCVLDTVPETSMETQNELALY